MAGSGSAGGAVVGGSCVSFGADGSDVGGVRGGGAGVVVSCAVVPVVSSVVGEPVDMGDPLYWVGQVRRTVRFADAVGWLEGRGVTEFVEVGPDGVLTGMVRDCLDQDQDQDLDLDSGVEPELVAVLRKDRPEPASFTAALARLHVRGVSPDWNAFFQGSGADRVDLPTYAFQHRNYWLAPAPSVPTPEAAAVGLGLGAAGIRCWAPRCRWPTRRVSCSPGGCRWTRIRGWPITRCSVR